MKNTVQITVLLTFIVFSTVLNVIAQEVPSTPAPAVTTPASSPEKLSDIRTLIMLTGGEQLGKQMINDIIDAFKENYPDVPAEFWDEFLNGNDVQTLIDSNIKVYDKHLSQDEIKEIIKFYESAAGKKLIEVLPAISQESYNSGEEWGYGIGKKVRDRLMEKGYIKEAPAAEAVPTPNTTPAPAPAAAQEPAPTAATP